MQAASREPFELSAGHPPLFRWALLRLASDDWIWFQAYHHIVVDGSARALIHARDAMGERKVRRQAPHL
jgi:hypothetical protein